MQSSLTVSGSGSSISMIGRSGPPLRLSDIIAKDLKEEFRYFLEYNPKAIGERNDEGSPLLVQLVVARAYKSALMLLERMDIGQIDCRDNNGLTALHHACAIVASEDQVLFDLVDKLLKNGASPYAMNHERYTPLHVAVFTENVELVKRLTLFCMLNSEKLDDPNKVLFREGTRTLLHEAALRCDKCFGFILTLTDRLDGKDPQRRTALHHAVMGKCSIKNTAMLCDKDAQKDIVDNNGETPLGIACREGKDVVASTLLSHGADPNIGVVPPILYAYLNGFADIFLLLLVKGANKDEKWGKNNLIEVAYARKDHESVDLLLKREATKTPSYLAMVSLQEKSEVSFFSSFVPDKVGNFTSKSLKTKEHLKINPQSSEKNTYLHELVLRSDIDFKMLLAHTKGKDWEVLPMPKE